MDLKDQLKNLFPDHPDPGDGEKGSTPEDTLWMQEEPILCKFEKRRGKAITILEGYTGADADFKKLCSDLKRQLGVGGSWKKDLIIIQGDYRDKIMGILKEMGFRVKRVGG